jgi:hypothetical protein
MVDITEFNPMDWHNTKVLDFIPDHFVRVKFRHNHSRAEVLSWLEKNTTGRYAIEAVTDHSERTGFGVLREDFQIGFENPAEATMYTMFFR